jgi:hypothetical protein
MQRPSGRVLLEGVARFIGFLAVAGVVACVGGLLVGALLHESARRGIAIGLYVTGSALAGFGVLVASRPPVRGRSDGGLSGAIGSIGGLFSAGGVRWASREEHQQAMNLPAVLIAGGVILVVLGAFVDVRH